MYNKKRAVKTEAYMRINGFTFNKILSY